MENKSNGKHQNSSTYFVFLLLLSTFAYLLRKLTLINMLTITNNHTLFLDRDGVINKNIDGSYVLDWAQFEFMPGVLETLPKLAALFPRIIIVTNQQCIAKGLITPEKLEDIHQKMRNVVELNGGRIDAVYYAPDLAAPDNNLRKPNNGMALWAQTDFPQIAFSRSVMVGDKISDMQFGKSVGMKTICLSTNYKENEFTDYTIKQFGELLNIFQ
ncbi:MAG TPA: HAD family hydrolase [Chitinophagales bacterium]|nr:HAD family hydrolase [Chitinophagales bacterium]